MESPIEVVRRFCAAWSDNIGAAELAAFFTDDAVYHNIPLAPVTGRAAIANNIASFIRPGAPGIEGIQFRVINIAANGPVVMTERVDVFKLPEKSFELPVMGTFEVSNGKISAWRDYFDMNQFTSRMGKVGLEMKSATELLEAYLNNVRTPKVSAAQFAEDGVLELPWVKAYARGPAEVEKMLIGLLARVPDFRFKNLTYFIQTPDRVAAEYQVEALVPDTGKIYKQTYAGLLLAENGKIKMLHENLNTLVGSEAFSKG